MRGTGTRLLHNILTDINYEGNVVRTPPREIQVHS